MKIALSSESTIDLTPELLDKFKIKVVPFMVSLGDEMFKDENGIAPKIFEYVEKTKILPKTSAVNQFEYSEYFKNILNEGYDAVIHICVSSKLSCTCENAKLAAKDVKNVYIIDSQQLSTGIAMLAIYARQLIDENKHSPEEIVSLVTSKIEQIQTKFVVENLTYFRKSGRCSALAMLGANLLRIKPELAIVDGMLKVVKKSIGSLYNVLDKYCKNSLNESPNANLEYAFITSSAPMPEIAENLKTILKNHGFKNIYETPAGGTVSSHCGPTCIGFVFDKGTATK